MLKNRILIIFLLLPSLSFGQITKSNSVVNNIYTGNGSWERNNIGIDTFNPVGIGSTNPGQSLDVQGTARMTGFNLSTSPSSGYVLTSDSSGTGTWQASSGGGGSNYWSLFSGNIGIGTTNNVGIGSTVPGQKLDVQGTIRSNYFTANAAAPTVTTLNSSTGHVLTTMGGLDGANTDAGDLYLSNGGSTIMELAPNLAAAVSFNPSNNSQTVWQLSYASGADTSEGALILEDAGVSKVLLTANHSSYLNGGNVGIGSTVPGQKLDIQGTARMTGFNLSTSPTNGYVLTSDGSGTGTWAVASGGSSQWTGTAGNPIYYLQNVGIGTSTTSAQLNVGTTGQATIDSSGNIATSGTITGHSTISANGTGSAFTQTGSSTTNSLVAQLNVPNISINPSLGLSGNVFKTVDNTNHVTLSVTGDVVTTKNNTLDGGTGTAFFLLNVGIGSLAPGQILDVQGTVRTTGFILSTGASNGYVLTSDATGNASWGAVGGTGTVTQIVAGTGLTGGTITTTGTIAVDYTTNNTWSGLNNFTGNVGISSATPGQKLDVNGNVRATSFIGSLTGNSSTSTALAANGTNCSAGNYPLGVDASGNSESCTAAATGTVTSISTTAPIAGGTITGTGTISCNVASGSQPGCLASADFTTFNGKQASLSLVAGTYVNGDMCTYASSGTLLNCNTTVPTGTVTSSGSPASGNIAKFTTGTNIAPAAASDIVGLFSTCSGTQYLGADGACHNSGGSASAAGGTNAVQYNSGSSTFAGSEAVFSMNGTNVGIGTNSGRALLDVVGAEIVTGNIGIGTTATDAYATIAPPNGGMIIKGNVGIGTFNPSNSLVVTGNMVLGAQSNGSGKTFYDGGGATFLAAIAVQASASGGATSLASFSNTGTAVNTAGQITLGTSDAGAVSRTTGIIGAIETATTSALQVGDLYFSPIQGNINNERMRITGNGNVGIGTSLPIGSLDVEGTINQSIFYGRVSGNVGIGTLNPGQALDVNGVIRSISTGNSLFTGNVGIGTTLTNQVLAINGSISYQVNAPTISSCGTVPNGSVVGNDAQGTITVGGTATACTLAFLGTYAKSPHCNITNQSMSITNAMTYTESTTGFVVSQAVGLSGDLLDYHCTFDN